MKLELISSLMIIISSKVHGLKLNFKYINNRNMFYIDFKGSK